MLPCPHPACVRTPFAICQKIVKPPGSVPVHLPGTPLLDETLAALRAGEKLCILELMSEATRAMTPNCPPNAENRHTAGDVEGM
jgi:hypothetical protein